MKKSSQHKCPGCGLLVVVEHDGSTLVTHHQFPPCSWFDNMLRQELGEPDAVTLSVREVEEPPP